MKKYNDYIKTTKQYLKSYNQFKAAIENIQKEIEFQTKIMNEVSTPISRYGAELGGGTGELTQVEAAATQRERIEEKIRSMKLDQMEIVNVLDKVDRAIDALDKDDKRLIDGYYKERMNWMDLSIELYMTEKWARERANKAIKGMAFTIFGPAALPPDKSFVFARSEE